jgi:hypothetical protein
MKIDKKSEESVYLKLKIYTFTMDGLVYTDESTGEIMIEKYDSTGKVTIEKYKEKSNDHYITYN